MVGVHPADGQGGRSTGGGPYRRRTGGIRSSRRRVPCLLPAVWPTLLARQQVWLQPRPHLLDMVAVKPQASVHVWVQGAPKALLQQAGAMSCTDSNVVHDEHLCPPATGQMPSTKGRVNLCSHLGVGSRSLACQNH